jgi:hypothetical protein
VRRQERYSFRKDSSHDTASTPGRMSSFLRIACVACGALENLARDHGERLWLRIEALARED